MDTFETRLVAEANDLYDKIQKLTAFVHGNKFENVSKEQCGLLYAQLQVMISYHAILRKRLTLLGVQCALPQEDVQHDGLFPPVIPIPPIREMRGITVVETGTEIPEVDARTAKDDIFTNNLNTSERWKQDPDRFQQPD
jgi:hypothetical protein